ncbi:hypothetical protein IAQ61_006059, partial [Plenodomus lingam]|uniref:uncharacterized protein n=1 Tax=Leptosphaeria maculans TaxID=5022 RepID=UPI0033334A11
MGTTIPDSLVIETLQSQEVTACELEDSHFQLPIRSSHGKMYPVIFEEEILRSKGSTVRADVDNNDLTGSWEKINISFHHQPHHFSEGESIPSKRASWPLMEDHDKFYDNIIAGDFAAIEAALDVHTNLERENDDGITPLVLSIIHSQFDIIRLLLEKGAEVDHPVDGVPPIVHAVENANKGPRVMQLLMDHGADPRIVSGRDNLNALHWATVFGTVDAVNFLAGIGLDLNSICSMGRTPLTLAAERGHTTIVKLLLAKGAELAKQSYNGGTALTWAANYGHLDTVKYLLEEGLDVNHLDSAGLTALWVASNAGHVQTVEFLISKGADINCVSIDPKGITPVSTSARSGRTDVVRALLRNGADLELPDHAGIRTLEATMTAGHMDTVKVLLEDLGSPGYPKDSLALQIAMADTRNCAVSLMAACSLVFPHVQPRPKEQGDVAWIDWVLQLGGNLVRPKAISIMLHVALTSQDGKVVEELLRLGADPNMFLPGRRGQTPLAIAIGLCDIDLVGKLLMHGADPVGRVDRYAEDDETALQQAVVVMGDGKDIHDKAAIVNLLLTDKRCKVNQGESTRYTAFSMILRQAGDWEDGIVKDLALRMADVSSDVNSERTSTGSTLMHVAVNRKCRGMIDVLLAKGADINAKDDMGLTPFLCICFSSTTMLPFLVERGADPSAKDEQGHSGLHIASMTGRIENMQYLLDIGLNIEDTTSDGHTPLLTALTSDQEDAALWLIDHGASTSITSCHGQRTILHHAARRHMNRVVASLLSTTHSTNHSATINLRDDMGQTPLSLACSTTDSQALARSPHALHALLSTLLSHGADPQSQDNTSTTPLHHALRTANDPAALLLLTSTPNLSLPTADGTTLLHLAAKHRCIRCTRFLLSHGANIDARDANGATPLSTCACTLSAVLLLDAGADIEHRDDRGWTPLRSALESGCLRMFDVLLQRGADLGAREVEEMGGLDVLGRVRRVGWEDGRRIQVYLGVLAGVREDARVEGAGRGRGKSLFGVGEVVG